MKLLVLLAACLATTLAIPVYVMMPLDMVNLDGNLKDANTLRSQLQTLKSGGVDGVMADVWWGIVERNTPRNYNFGGYLQFASMVAEVGLKAQVVMSFHRCGGNVGDDCNIPLPNWVLSYGASDPDIFYTDQWGHRDEEYISLGADSVVINGRTVRRIYAEYMQAFANAFHKYLASGTITEIQVGLGPCGELRYPGYQQDRWTFPGVGAFQCFDKRMLASWRSYASSKGHPEWNSPPTDAGNYNSKPTDTNFFNNGYSSEYGRVFLSWYSNVLVEHGDDILSDAKQVFTNSSRLYPQTSISSKISGIHWWYKSASHAAELTAGYYNTNGNDGYGNIAKMFKRNGATVDFTCFEMHNSEQQSHCGPEDLVAQVLKAAAAAGAPGAGENALAIFDTWHYDQIVKQATAVMRIDAFTYLRLSSQLLNSNNWYNFCQFVKNMHSK